MTASSDVWDIKDEIDVDIDYDDYEELYEYEDILWNLEEVNIMTNGLKENISKEQLNRFRALAEQLMDWFSINVDNLDFAISEFAQEGIRIIRNIFPDM